MCLDHAPVVGRSPLSTLRRRKLLATDTIRPAEKGAFGALICQNLPCSSRYLVIDRSSAALHHWSTSRYLSIDRQLADAGTQRRCLSSSSELVLCHTTFLPIVIDMCVSPSHRVQPAPMNVGCFQPRPYNIHSRSCGVEPSWFRSLLSVVPLVGSAAPLLCPLEDRCPSCPRMSTSTPNLPVVSDVSMMALASDVEQQSSCHVGYAR